MRIHYPVLFKCFYHVSNLIKWQGLISFTFSNKIKSFVHLIKMSHISSRCVHYLPVSVWNNLINIIITGKFPHIPHNFHVLSVVSHISFTFLSQHSTKVSNIQTIILRLFFCMVIESSQLYIRINCQLEDYYFFFLLHYLPQVSSQPIHDQIACRLRK